ncbi:MAG: hypothetical protein ACM3WT_01980, partial [Bacillota bacterium]
PAGPGAARGWVPAADVRNARSKLEASGTTLDCGLPLQSPPMSYLAVRPSSERVRDILARLQASRESAGLSLATLLDNGVLLYTGEVTPGGARLRKADAVLQATGFIERYAGRLEGINLDYAVSSGDAWVVNFCAEFDERPVFGSHITVKVFPSGVAEARFALFEPIGYSQQRRSILPSTEAVITAASSLGAGARGESIINVSLGYHSEPYNARQWESVPVWRVLFASGREVYVNAHTGEVEKPELVGR